jgi:hypothetical protein
MTKKVRLHTNCSYEEKVFKGRTSSNRPTEHVSRARWSPVRGASCATSDRVWPFETGKSIKICEIWVTKRETRAPYDFQKNIPEKVRSFQNQDFNVSTLAREKAIFISRLWVCFGWSHVITAGQSCQSIFRASVFGDKKRTTRLEFGSFGRPEVEEPPRRCRTSPRAPPRSAFSQREDRDGPRER